MKLVSTVLLLLFFVVLIDAKRSNNHQRFHANTYFSNFPVLTSRYNDGNSKTMHEIHRHVNTKCPCPTNQKYEQQTITLMTQMLTELQQISKTLQQPIKFQMDEQKTMEDNSIIEEETQNDNIGKTFLSNEENLREHFYKEDEVTGNSDGDVVNESKNTERPRQVAEEPEDNIRPISFVPVNSKILGKHIPLDHGSRFY